MRNLDEPIDIKQFAADLMSLTSGDIEELTKELRDNWWKDYATNDVRVTPNTLMSWAIIGAAKELDKTKAETNLQVAKWFKKYRELEDQHEEDELWMQQTREEIKFWTEFWRYITDEAIGEKQCIIEAVANNDHNRFEGYVEVTKSINDKQELLIKFKSSKGQEYTATWQPSDNYACWQTCGYAGDDYSGFLLFPTYKENRYFCIWYSC